MTSVRLVIAPFSGLRQYVSREFWTIFALLAEEHGWDRCETWDLPSRGDLRPSLERRFGVMPEVVLFWESYPELALRFPAFAKCGTHVYVMTDDLHYRRAGMGVALRLAHGVLSTYAPRLAEVFPKVDASRVTWVPHAAGPDFLFQPCKDPAPVVLVSGSISRVYPLRQAMRELALRRPDLARLQHHPGYRSDYDHDRDRRVGRGYGEALHACLAAFTDASSYHYIVAKHFEIPATGALLIADRAVAPQLAALGFIDGVHYVSTTADELEQTVLRALDPRNAAEVDSIRRAGHALVHAHHTTAHRARQIDAVCI